MPEGHVTHRNARIQSEVLGLGTPVAVSSPQGRFDNGSDQLDGQNLEDIEAYGKHMFYHWENGATLHIHLGLIGKFQIHTGDGPAPTYNTRLKMTGSQGTVFLVGPMICTLISPEEEDVVLAKLGPDPLRSGREGKKFAERLASNKVPVGAALLDQSIIAGIGNVFRAELLFLTGIHPNTPSSALTDNQKQAIWKQAVAELRIAENIGDIITVNPRHVGARSRKDLNRKTGVYVYKRDGMECRICGTEIHLEEVAKRKIWHCPTCQPKA